MNKLYLIFISILFLSISCVSYSPEIEVVLQQAGKNRSQLEKVLKHYAQNPADSLKLKSAEFLIINMPEKYSEFYDAPWNDVATVCLRWSSSSDIQSVLDTYELGDIVKQDDVTHITADFLIENIDLAFEVWQKRPWNKHVSFDVFCEEILPYRVGTEQLENWRRKALAIFADLEPALNQPSTTAVDACCLVNNLLPRFKMDKDYASMNFSQLMASARGMCDDMTALSIFSMRALGIPVTFEFTPLWVNWHTGHSWSAVRDSAGRHIFFSGAETNPNQPHVTDISTKSKIYRKTFAIQHNIAAGKNDIPFLLEDHNTMIDVSSEYAGFLDTLAVSLQYAPPTQLAQVYLAFEQEYNWHPVAWTANTGQTVRFNHVGKNILYMPVYYANRRQSSAGAPFVLSSDGTIVNLLTHSSTDSILLQRHEIAPSGQDYVYRASMRNSTFEGANKPDFSDATTLHTLKNPPDASYSYAVPKTSKKFRYLRYKSPENIHCDIAEMTFYNTDGKKLSGTILGIDSVTGSKAFDNDITTWYSTAESNGWIGIDFAEAEHIAKIRYLPRSGELTIYEGHDYELYGWTKDGWQSMGRQTATGNTIQYHVPARSLFYLNNVTLNKQGKVFFVTQDKQIKWRPE
jgi:hypothetical protein